jgi:hypothetical protein
MAAGTVVRDALVVYVRDYRFALNYFFAVF